jgi:hypothetical protein
MRTRSSAASGPFSGPTTYPVIAFHGLRLNSIVSEETTISIVTFFAYVLERVAPVFFTISWYMKLVNFTFDAEVAGVVGAERGMITYVSADPYGFVTLNFRLCNEPHTSAPLYTLW